LEFCGGNWKCIGVGLSSKDWRVKKLRVNEFVEMDVAALYCFAILLAFTKLAIEV